MPATLHISAHNHELTEVEEERIRAMLTRLERFYDRLIACRVVVDVPNRRSTGAPIAWLVRLSLTVPGGELIVNHQAKETFRDALDDTFEAARRQLEDHAREIRGATKSRAAELQG